MCVPPYQYSTYYVLSIRILAQPRLRIPSTHHNSTLQLAFIRNVLDPYMRLSVIQGLTAGF